MKRNKLFILGLIFAFVAVLSLTLVSGTWAKYTSNVTSAEVRARVAKWEWTVNSQKVVGDGKVTTEIAFDLFKTIKDTGKTNEEDVAKTDEDKTAIIAPGTTGEATFKVTNSSEVTGKVEVKFLITGVGTESGKVPLSFFTNGSTTAAVTTTETIDSVTYTVVKVTVEKVTAGGNTDVVLGWEWAIGDGATDGSDTALGEAGTAEVTVTAKLTFTQVD